MTKVPKRFMKFKDEYPKIAEAYDKLGEAVHDEGPLDDKTRALIKLAISASIGSEGAVHSHTRRAIEKGISAEEIRHAILLSLPTIGLPKMMAAFSWAEDILEG